MNIFSLGGAAEYQLNQNVMEKRRKLNKSLYTGSDSSHFFHIIHHITIPFTVWCFLSISAVSEISFFILNGGLVATYSAASEMRLSLVFSRLYSEI